MRLAPTLFASLALAAPLVAQTAKPLAYDHIAVQLSPATASSDVRRDPVSLHATGWPLESILEMAYGIDHRLIFGLSPAQQHARYNVEATLSPARGHGDSSTLLRALLASEFGLEARMEHREAAVYELSLGPGGPFFQPVPASSGNTSTSRGDGYISSSAATMQQIARTFGSSLDRPVHDATGLSALYTINLHYDASAPAGDAQYVALAKALHDQLGLDLRPAIAPVKVLVVEKLDTSAISAKASLN